MHTAARGAIGPDRQCFVHRMGKGGRQKRAVKTPLEPQYVDRAWGTMGLSMGLVRGCGPHAEPAAKRRRGEGGGVACGDKPPEQPGRARGTWSPPWGCRTRRRCAHAGGAPHPCARAKGRRSCAEWTCMGTKTRGGGTFELWRATQTLLVHRRTMCCRRIGQAAELTIFGCGLRPSRHVRPPSAKKCRRCHSGAHLGARYYALKCPPNQAHGEKRKRCATRCAHQCREKREP